MSAATLGRRAVTWGARLARLFRTQPGTPTAFARIPLPPGMPGVDTHMWIPAPDTSDPATEATR